MSVTTPKPTALTADNAAQALEILTCSPNKSLPTKADVPSMEFPLFSLSKQKDVRLRQFVHGERSLKIIPTMVGAATVFDKDLLLFVGSQIVEARNKGQQVSRTVQVDTAAFLNATNRGDGRKSYKAIVEMLQRLRGTTIQTDIPTGNDEIMQTEGFGMIDQYKVLSSKTKTHGGQKIELVYSFTVTINEWLYNSLLSYDILTIDPDYFSLSKAIERRIYEIARKYCGDKPIWKINIDLLSEKVGTKRERFKFRNELRQIMRDDHLPQYKIALDLSKSPDDVVFYTRDEQKFSKELVRTKPKEWHEWFLNLEKH